MRNTNILIKVAVIISAFFIACSAFAQEQSSKITGKVIDPDGLPVVGAAVMQIGTTNGAVTDLEGKFTLFLEEGKRIVNISCIGFDDSKISIGKKSNIKVTLQFKSVELDAVAVVAYGVQKKETVTGSISSVNNEDLLTSPNPSVANSLSGQLSGVSTVQSSGQPGLEDPKIFVRGRGSLNNSSPLILVDGIEMPFFQMDPNEIEQITVLKDASATAVFGVRGANGVILVTTRSGKEGKAKITLSSSFGIVRPTRLLEMTDSYEYALKYNELSANDGVKPEDFAFQPFALDAFKNNSDPIMYSSMDWADYLYKDFTTQTHNNVNISGGTKVVKYFASMGIMDQQGLLKQFSFQNYNNNYNFRRYNFRANLDVNVTNTTTVKMNIGGIIGRRHQPIDGGQGTWRVLYRSVPFSSPGFIDGQKARNDTQLLYGLPSMSALDAFYGNGYTDHTHNTMNLNLQVTQKLDFITKGLKMQVKGAYNTKYSFTKVRKGGSETLYPIYKSFYEQSGLRPGDEGFDYTTLWQIEGKNGKLKYGENNSKDRDWYLEGSLRYNRKFGGTHNITGLLLYNQTKRYYPKQFTAQPSGYVGFVGRVTYDYKTKYLVEFNAGYNGSENFAPGNSRYGFFPALSVGWIPTEEKFMQNQNVFSYLKFRVTCGLVGNDNMQNNRYLYLPDSYKLKVPGYNFGLDTPQNEFAVRELRYGNPNVTWETAFKQNYGVEAKFLNGRLKFTGDYFREDREDILITRKTIPGVISLNPSIVPVVNLGKVENNGFEIELNWNDKVGDLKYWLTFNTSYAKNKIKFMDEIEPNEPYMARTGRSMGVLFGFVDNGFYSDEDFDAEGNLLPNLPDPEVPVCPGDVKYEDLNNDGIINNDDQKSIGYSMRPEYVFGFNYGFKYKKFSLTMNWSGTAHRSVLLSDVFRVPFGNTSNRALVKYISDESWTPDTANSATMPRLSQTSSAHNYKNSTLWVKNGAYLRLKTLKLNYNVKRGKFLKSIGVSNLNLYISGYNLLTFDNLKYTDPESNMRERDISYPITQTYNLGATINF